MKKICVFLSILISVIAVGSCQSHLSSSSSDTDSVSYAMGVMWGYQVVSDRLQFVNISDAIKELKIKSKEPISAENNIYTASAEFRELLQKSTQRVYSSQEKKQIAKLLGTLWAHLFRETNIPRINLNFTKQGIKDMLKNDTTVLQIGIQQSSNYISEYRAKLEEIENEKRLKEGQAFLEKNKNEEGVVTTESGLQYKVINRGSDKKAEISDTAYLNISITQTDGDTIENNKSKAYYVDENRFIKGVWESLQLFG
ncbi:MAG: FKBP-type peptidyl-prolyl cis-trans isomerase N-terminal domain-containing protein, partial [Prevotellaceae bacterium]|nr:FKBP-type peptidyl-prolyl cis-trans isomerase N-terminal domain-containing protein [Prevotellaceae bacterium]